ncbi:MAG: AcrR family transcriptional regulator [Dinoroseobacter sp.]
MINLFKFPMSEARRRRGDETRQRLMRATEYLVAQNGIENVTVRAIIQEAKQKNESALQYHFKNRGGLLKAIYDDRNGQVLAARQQLLKPYLNGKQASLADICRLMVLPSFELARDDVGFRYYVCGFGPRIEQSSSPVRMVFDNAKGEGASLILNRLHELLNELPDAIVHLRLESILRFTAMSMSHQAADKRGFAGPAGERFIANLQDTMCGILSAPVSPATAKLFAD